MASKWNTIILFGIEHIKYCSLFNRCLANQHAKLPTQGMPSCRGSGLLWLWYGFGLFPNSVSWPSIHLDPYHAVTMPPARCWCPPAENSLSPIATLLLLLGCSTAGLPANAEPTHPHGHRFCLCLHTMACWRPCAYEAGGRALGLQLSCRCLRSPIRPWPLCWAIRSLLVKTTS